MTIPKLLTELRRIGSYRIPASTAEAITSSFRHVPGSDWMDDAACSSSPDPERFFPRPQATLGELRVRQVLMSCAACPVRRPCLRYALETRSDGIWGGLREPDRERLAARIRDGELTVEEAVDVGDEMHRYYVADKWQLREVARAEKETKHGISRSA